MPETIAVYPGTFDPVTRGHLDIIGRGARIFERVIVAILKNPGKQPMFTLSERKAMLAAAVSGLDNVEIDSFGGLLVDYARKCGARVIVRGLRVVSDFEYEFQMALMNRNLDAAIETVFMMPREDYAYVSSGLVREVAMLGGDVGGLVPDPVAEALRQRSRARRRRG